MLRITATIIFLLGFTCNMQAQSLPVHRTQIFPMQLPDPDNFGGKVVCVFQDKFGFMWVGKNTGLFRFDGNKVKTFRNDPANPNSISGNFINTITADTSGNLLIGTGGYGLSCFNQKTKVFTNYLHDNSNPLSISHNELQSICPDGKGNFWIGTDGGGLDLFNPKTGEFKHYTSGLLSKRIQEIIPAGNNKWWISTWGGGLHVLNGETKQIRALWQGTKYEESKITCSKEVSPGILWVAAYRVGLLAYDIKKNIITTVVNSQKHTLFRRLLLTPKGEIYAGGPFSLLYFPSAQSTFRAIGDSIARFNTISNFYLDKTQSIWVITYNGMLGKINSFGKKFHSFQPLSKFPTAMVRSMATTANALYYSCNNELYKYTANANVSEKVETAGKNISLITEMPGSDQLICFTDKDFLLYDCKKRKTLPVRFENTNDSRALVTQCRWLYCPGPDTFWVAGFTSAFQVAVNSSTGASKIVREFPIGADGSIAASQHLTCFFRYPGQVVAIGTWGGGLNLWDEKKNQFKYFTHQADNKLSISNNYIVCVARATETISWIGTHCGLNKFDFSTNTFQQLVLNDGLADDWIFAIAIDRKQRVWASTRQGISMVTGNMKTIENYNIYDGLPANEFMPRSVATDNSGRIFFGSVNGLVWFYPDSIYHNPNLPVPAISDFEINGKTIEVTSSTVLKQGIEFTREIHLSNKQSSFSFHLAALSYFNPGRNKIKYKLEGFDNTWQLAGKDQMAVYSDVPPGTYTFSVMAANEDGIWNPIEKNIKIRIVEPWWLSAWAIVLYIVLLFTLVAIFVLGYKKIKSKMLAAITEAETKQNKKLLLIQPNRADIDSADALFLQKALQVVEENMQDRNFGVEQFCEKMGMSRHRLFVKIEALARVTLAEFIREVRLKRAAKLLLQNEQSISEVASLVGFSDPRYFRKCFKEQFGVAPANFVERNSKNLPPNSKNLPLG